MYRRKNRVREDGREEEKRKKKEGERGKFLLALICYVSNAESEFSMLLLP